LQSTRSKAPLAASRMNCGGLYPKKPCPKCTTGWLGAAAAASFIIDLVFVISRTHEVCELHTKNRMGGAGSGLQMGSSQARASSRRVTAGFRLLSILTIHLAAARIPAPRASTSLS
jgi:hypothetical protein